MMTSISPLPVAYIIIDRMMPAYGSIINGKILSPIRPVAAKTWAAMTLIR